MNAETIKTTITQEDVANAIREWEQYATCNHCGPVAQAIRRAAGMRDYFTITKYHTIRPHQANILPIAPFISIGRVPDHLHELNISPRQWTPSIVGTPFEIDTIKEDLTTQP